MNKSQKLEFQQQIEGYLEENHVYDLFESLMMNLIKDKPIDPIQYLVQKLETPQPKRIIIMGPPGSQRKEYALALAEYFSFGACISVGDLLSKEIAKKSELGRLIADSRKTYSYVDDEVVLELVKKQIDELESENKSWIIEGFPRTRVQALSFQKMGIIADKIILLNVDDAVTSERIKTGLSNKDNSLNASFENYKEEDMEEIANSAVAEYKLNITEVKQAWKGFVCEIDANKNYDQVLEDIARLMKLRIKTNAPRRPPRLIIVGPPGSGRSTQAEIIAKKYGLIKVSTSNLLKAEIAKKTKTGKLAANLMREGDLVPDELMMSIVEERLSASDCRVNGWILDGFPKTEGQINLLHQTKIYPSLVIIMEIDDDVAYQRIEFKKIDPLTGIIYNMQLNEPENEAVLGRLVSLEEDKHEVVKKRIKSWKNFSQKIEEAYKEKIISTNADKDIDGVTEAISYSIENEKL